MSAPIAAEAVEICLVPSLPAFMLIPCRWGPRRPGRYCREPAEGPPAFSQGTTENFRLQSLRRDQIYEGRSTTVAGGTEGTSRAFLAL
jgi:hypothetical protein